MESLIVECCIKFLRFVNILSSMKKILFGCLVVVLFFSCSVDEVEKNSANGQEPVLPEGIEVKDGYLCFANDSVFRNYMTEFVDNKGIATRSRQNFEFKTAGFKSIASMKENLRAFETRATESDDEEMTIDEYNLMKAENLLLDPALEEMMDTTLRIQVSDRLYKVTKFGTFSAPTDNVKYLNSAIASFDTTLVCKCVNGETVDLGHGVVFANTFGDSSVQDIEMEGVDDIHTRSSIADSDVNLQAGYNTVSYAWKNHSLWQKFWDSLRGKAVTRENNFDKKHRVQMEVFNVNYLFYASAGVKVKMQRRKKFWFVKYWVSENADKIAVGFNNLTGTLKFRNPASYSSINPPASALWGRFKGTLNGQTNDFVMTTYHNLPVVKDWVEDIYMMLPFVDVVETKLRIPSSTVLNAMYNTPAKEMSKLLQSVNNCYFNKIQKRIQPKDPRIAYMVWGESDMTFDKSKPYIMGVMEYNSVSSKTIRFDQSFGFSFNNGKVKGFLPSEFKIENIDAFGAALYRGQWRGVRFVKTR